VKFITDDYLSAYEQEKKHLKEKAKEHEKTHSSKDHNQAPEKPRKNSTVNDKPIGKFKDILVVEKPAESKKEQKKQKEAKKGNNPDKPKKPLTAFFRFQMEKLNTVKEEYPNLSHTEAVSVTSQLWGQMSPEERLPY
jgi:structure-specific recognition protein 1